MDVKRIHRIEVTSTNTYVKELLGAGIELPELAVVDADYQSGGRGQAGNRWESERGMNLTFSLVCHPTFVRATEQFILSQASAVAVFRVLDGLTGGISIKWPNDIYWQDRKICGTLIECNLEGATVRDCIIGTGINVNQMVFRSDAPNPVSLAQIACNMVDGKQGLTSTEGITFNREKILSEVVKAFGELYEQIREGRADDIRREYMLHMYRHEGFYLYREHEGEPFMAEIADVGHDGLLTLRLRDGGTRKYEFKEIKYII